MLNGRIKGSGDSGTYKGGSNPGVIVRTPDFFDNGGPEQVVPATLWHNDIYAPSQLYPTYSSPWCPNYGWDGFYSTSTCANDQVGPWTFATVAVVMAGAMEEMFDDFSNIMTDNWANGVFYASDANAADSRCIWRQVYNGWDCPGGWIDYDSGEFDADDHQGSGVYAPGNPDVKGFEDGGGGSGCHFDQNANAIDQPDAYGDPGNLVQDLNCQCNYGFASDWNDWVTTWAWNTQQKSGFENRWSFGTQAPAWGVDTAACWVSNPRDMIGIQNALYWQRATWNNQLIPQSDWSSQSSEEYRKYWGWNEVPVPKWVVNDATQWDAIIVKLPADVCENGDWGVSDDPSCLSKAAQQQLENDLEQFEQQNKLFPGIDNISNRPGSYIMFVREYGQTFQTSDGMDVNWSREFFCSNWESPSGKYKVVYSNSGKTGACYIERGSTATV